MFYRPQPKKLEFHYVTQHNFKELCYYENIFIDDQHTNELRDTCITQLLLD